MYVLYCIIDFSRCNEPFLLSSAYGRRISCYGIMLPWSRRLEPYIYHLGFYVLFELDGESSVL